MFIYVHSPFHSFWFILSQFHACSSFLSLFCPFLTHDYEKICGCLGVGVILRLFGIGLGRCMNCMDFHCLGCLEVKLRIRPAFKDMTCKRFTRNKDIRNIGFFRKRQLKNMPQSYIFIVFWTADSAGLSSINSIFLPTLQPIWHVYHVFALSE